MDPEKKEDKNIDKNIDKNPADTGASDATKNQANENKKLDAEGDTPEIYKPEGMADHYMGVNNNETIDKLHKAVDGYRKDQAKGNNFPEKLDDYDIKLSDDLSTKLLKPGEDGKDLLFEKFRTLFHEKKIDPEIAGEVLAGLYEEANKASENLEGGDKLDFEFKDLGGEDKAQPVIDAINLKLQALQKEGRINEGDVEEFLLNTTHSKGLGALSRLLKIDSEIPIPTKFDGSAGGDTITEQALNARVSDPRYIFGTPKFEESFYEETTKMFEDFYNKEEK